jgi:hypothetical protein
MVLAVAVDMRGVGGGGFAGHRALRLLLEFPKRFFGYVSVDEHSAKSYEGNGGRCGLVRGGGGGWGWELAAVKG